MTTITELVQDAEAISAPVSTSCDDVIDVLSAKITSRMLDEPDIDELVPESKLSMMRDNHVNHLRYMESLPCVYTPQSFVQTVIWAMSTYRGHGFAIGYWDKMLRHCLEVLAEDAPETYAATAPFYEWILRNLDALDPLTAPAPQSREDM